MKPLAIDLFCGLGGWTDGLLAEGWDVVGFDIEVHDYGDGKRYPSQLVLQDVLTVHGRQFKDAALIVASPPCQEFSYMAMPWSRGKSIASEYRSGARDAKNLTALFDACFRIQREAIEAAGHFIPMVVENVRGAQPWVGKARWAFGSFYLWGDVPALMPITMPRVRMKSAVRCSPRNFSDRVCETEEEAHRLHYRLPNSDGLKRKYIDGYERIHPNAFGWQIPNTSSGSPGRKQKQANTEGVKTGGNSFIENGSDWMISRGGPKSKSRKAASAAIAKIPLPLARWIGKVYRTTHKSK